MEGNHMQQWLIAALAILLDNAMEVTKYNKCTIAVLVILLDKAMECDQVQWTDNCSLGDIVR